MLVAELSVANAFISRRRLVARRRSARQIAPSPAGAAAVRFERGAMSPELRLLCDVQTSLHTINAPRPLS